MSGKGSGVTRVASEPLIWLRAKVALLGEGELPGGKYRRDKKKKDFNLGRSR